MPGDSFWQCLVPQMGLFWQTESWPWSYFFFLECAGPCKQPRLHVKNPCCLLQGFVSTGSCTVLVLGVLRAGTAAPVCFVLFGMLPTRAPTSGMPELPYSRCQAVSCASGRPGDEQDHCPLWLQWREQRDVCMAWITSSLIPPALQWHLRNIHSAEGAQKSLSQGNL